MATCPHCGSHVADGMRYCEHCGQELPAPGFGPMQERQDKPHKVLIACMITFMAIVVVLDVALFMRSRAQQNRQSAVASGEAAENAPLVSVSESAPEANESAKGKPGPAIAYTWEHEQSGDEGSASTDIWYPVFSTKMGDTSTVDAINADVRARVQTARDSLASWKPWAYVDLYPAITLLNEEYLSIHYYHVYDAGTYGTLSIAGEGGLYDLADGGKNVSPSVLLGITEDELLAKSDVAVDASTVLNQAKYSSDIAQMMDEGSAGYVVLQDGVYVYLRGVSVSDSARMSYHLVGVCDLDGNAFEEPPVIDLASETQFAHYRDLSREAGEIGAEQDEPVAVSTDRESEHEQLRDAALQRGDQVFEGTVRVLNGEELSAISGVPITANGESVAQTWRDATYVILELDGTQSVYINNRGMDNMTVECASVGLGRNDSSYVEDLPIDTWMPYDGKRICVASPTIGASQGVDIYGPWLYEAELVYEAAE